MIDKTGGPAFPVVFEHNECTSEQEGMTLRQYAAIKLRVPDSGTDWLDEMIRKSLIDTFAAKAMQGEVSAQTAEDYQWIEFNKLAAQSYEIADAMLKARVL